MTRPLHPLLEARNLGKEYVQKRRFGGSRFTVRAFEGVNLAIWEGVTLAIVGESGAGKSSLARCLALLESPTRGAIYFRGQEVNEFDQNRSVAPRRQIQLIFQDPTSAINPRFTAAEIVAEPLVVQRIGGKAEQRERAIRLMRLVGLPPNCESKRAFEFSGGQRQRLAIARALSLEPKLLILDEALSSLDRANQQGILELLGDLQAAHSLACVHISHDISMVERFADQVAVMEGGEVVEQKRAAQLFSCPERAATRRLLGAATWRQEALEELKT
jgi:ABC-type glutathione transport system ATPase component